MKQRLVGAIVLVALAVIFLPMLLDGSGRSGPVDVAIEIPEPPEPPANRLAEGGDFADTRLAGGGPAGAAPGEAMSEPAAPDGAALAAPTGTADEGRAEDASLGDRAAKATPADEPSTSEPAAAADPADGAGSGADAAASGETAEADEPRAWAVQAGSFRRETNALVLRDRLREADFDAFAERGTADGETVWRVRVGPVATRAEAEELGERLTDERGEPVLVVAHP